MQVFIAILYLIVGIAQLFAIMDGLEYVMGIGGIINFFLSLILAYTPIVGSILGVYGAVSVWGWGLLQAFLLFFGYIILAIVFTAIEMAFSRRS